jgi:type IV secretory pathway VirD2 relaxase
MASRMLDPLFDLASYARPGPGRRDHLTPAQIQQIARTASRTPEVMVKVLPRGANDLGAVRRHLDYIGRKGDVDLETDDGQTLRGTHVGTDLAEDWDLELDAHRSGADLVSRPRQQVPRLVHKLMFSMPAGTPPDKVLKAVQNFFREEFALKHRYVMALHTDTDHPHVHVVLKAVSEQGDRLHIRKSTLRQWREEFARHLRALGVPANATQRYIRGETSPRKLDGIHRASMRKDSTHMRERAEAAAHDLSRGDVRVQQGKAKVVQTRDLVQRAWSAVSEILVRDQQPDLALQVRRFAQQMPPALTERERLTGEVLERTRPPRAREGPTH